MNNRTEMASTAFLSGCNCAQAVLSSFSDLLQREESELLAMSAGFGGGMGKLQNTCGAVTGAFMVFSLYASDKSADNKEAKDLSATMIRDFDKKFKELKVSSSCRDILGVDMHSEAGKKEIAEKKLFETVCLDAVVSAVGIVEMVLSGR